MGAMSCSQTSLSQIQFYHRIFPTMSFSTPAKSQMHFSQALLDPDDKPSRLGKVSNKIILLPPWPNRTFWAWPCRAYHLGLALWEKCTSKNFFLEYCNGKSGFGLTSSLKKTLFIPSMFWRCSLKSLCLKFEDIANIKGPLWQFKGKKSNLFKFK